MDEVTDKTYAFIDLGASSTRIALVEVDNGEISDLIKSKVSQMSQKSFGIEILEEIQ